MAATLRLPVVLGSSSKWRRAVVEEGLGLAIARTVSPDIDEKAIRHPDPSELVRLLAHAKADAVLPQVPGPSRSCCPTFALYILFIYY
jgi:septum formation protein